MISAGEHCSRHDPRWLPGLHRAVPSTPLDKSLRYWFLKVYRKAAVSSTRNHASTDAPVSTAMVMLRFDWKYTQKMALPMSPMMQPSVNSGG